MKPQALTINDYSHMKSGGQVLEADGFGEKVILLKDGTFLKLFRRKRLISSALWSPYSTRFIKNCQRLKALGILAPTILGFYRVSELKRDLVHYRGVPGETLRNLAKQETLPARTENNLKKFVKSLHAQGIFFRSLHAGNIVVSGESFGLIDVSDMKFHRKALSNSMISRNLKHIRTDPLLRKFFA
jgi:tRNA A-37 threonylcarbamoyl transferase component Bud32